MTPVNNRKRRKIPRRPDGYFSGRERNLVPKAGKLKRGFKKIRAWVDRCLKDHPEYRYLVSVMMLWMMMMVMMMMMMKRYGLSIRRMIDEQHPCRGARKVARLDWVPSGSWLHKWMHRL